MTKIQHVHCDKMVDGGREHCGHNPCCQCGYVKLAEPEVPEEVKDLLSPTCQNLWEPSKKEYDAAVLEAFRRGRSKG